MCARQKFQFPCRKVSVCPSVRPLTQTLSPQENTTSPLADLPTNSQDLQYLIREATLILKEPLEAMAGPLRVHRNHLQVTPTETSLVHCR